MKILYTVDTFTICAYYITTIMSNTRGLTFNILGLHLKWIYLYKAKKKTLKLHCGLKNSVHSGIFDSIESREFSRAPIDEHSI